MHTYTVDLFQQDMHELKEKLIWHNLVDNINVDKLSLDDTKYKVSILYARKVDCEVLLQKQCKGLQAHIQCTSGMLNNLEIHKDITKYKKRKRYMHVVQDIPSLLEESIMSACQTCNELDKR